MASLRCVRSLRVFSFLLVMGALVGGVTVPGVVMAKAKKDEQTLLGTFGGWRAFTFEEKGQRVCYMTTTIKAGKHKGLTRASSRLAVTHRPGENSKDVVSYAAGYSFKSGSDVTIRVDKTKFDMFTDKDHAWTRNAMADRALTDAMRRGTRVTLTGAPAKRGVARVTDTVSLGGSDKAYRAISKACGVHVADGKDKKPKASKKR